MFKRSIYFVIGYVVVTLGSYANTIHSLNRVQSPSQQLAWNGRAVFEAYPNAEIKHWNHQDAKVSREDQAYIQNYPPIMTREEILKLHREIDYKEHRFLDVLGLSYNAYPKTIRFIQLLIQKSNAPIYYLKQFNQRPRPFKILSSSFIPIDKPITSSYPSKGATEGMLVALFLRDIFENPVLKNAVLKLGKEMGTRRELAGVAFPSDTRAGRILALKLKEILSEDKIVKKALLEARKELSAVAKLLPSIDDAISFAETGNRLVFKNTNLKEFLSQIQLLTEKRITLIGEYEVFVNEQFESNEWPAYLDLIAWENGLKISEDDKTIIITKANKNYEN